MMVIPASLKSDIETGRSMLFLGAGASRGARNNNGEEPPLASDMAKLLADRFLGGKFIDKGLQSVAELAIHTNNINHVQRFIAEILTDFKPANFHLLIPKFKWRAIFTVNYDRIVESAYNELGTHSLQTPFVVLSNQDKIDDLFRSRRNVPLIKLHGCITRTSDPNVSMMITPDQFAKYKEGREQLYSTLQEWGNEYPVIFAGFGMQDTDLRIILAELDKLGDVRPMYYIVSNSYSAEETSLWAAKRINILNGTFEDFLNAIDNQTSEPRRKLLAEISPEKEDHILESKFVKKEKISEVTMDFLQNDTDYINPNLPIGNYENKNFYRGFDLGWFGIVKRLDIKRDLLEKILYEGILTNEDERPANVDFYLIKSHAGAGKTVLLRRLAWTSGVEAKLLCLHIKDRGQISYSAIKEIYRLTKERIFLFIDDVNDKTYDIKRLIENARLDNISLTVVGTVRVNEWNMYCEDLNPYLSRAYSLNYLTPREINDLIKVLEENNSLGHLGVLSNEKRIAEFTERAGRQLLVALHEVTEGKPFIEIILDEYKNIYPPLAKSIYLTVCALNRFKIPVRAGLISRVYNVPFTEFKKKFFNSLDHIVRTDENNLVGDFVYSARHSEIASMVFEQALQTTGEKFDEYIRILGGLNLAYSTDLQAFRKLIHGRALLNNFPDHSLVVEIFKSANIIQPNDAYVLQQHGIYEMNRPSGNLDLAYKHLKEAQLLNDKDLTILHSLAELSYIRSEKADNLPEKERFRRDAMDAIKKLLEDKDSRKYARHTLIKIEMRRLEEDLETDAPEEIGVQKAVEGLEELFNKGLTEDPEDSLLLITESKFQELIENKAKALITLKKAFTINKRNPYIAIRLAKHYQNVGNPQEALNTLEESLAVNANNLKLHYQFAMLIRESNKNPDTPTMLYHLKRSFTPGDSSYSAHFWYAYYCFLSTDADTIKEGKLIFKNLRTAYTPYETKSVVRAFIEVSGERRNFEGVITKKEDSYFFIRRDGEGDEIFTHKNNVDEKLWEDLVKGQRINFNIGFDYGGATGINIRVK